MFGFSLTKLVVLAAIVVAVWYGFKVVGRLDRARKARLKEASKSREATAEDMQKCPVCGVYVAAVGATDCGRADCPYPG